MSQYPSKKQQAEWEKAGLCRTCGHALWITRQDKIGAISIVEKTCRNKHTVSGFRLSEIGG